MSGERTFELACASCGATVVLHPPRRIAIERVLALIMLPAIIPGLIFLSRARTKARAWTDNPVVEGATPIQPANAGLPSRQCSCLGIADGVAIVMQGRWDFVLGTRHEYRCRVCSRQFAVHDRSSIVSAALISAGLVAAGWFVIVHPPGAAVGAERSNQWFGVASVAIGVLTVLLFLRRAWSRVAHPLT